MGELKLDAIAVRRSNILIPIIIKLIIFTAMVTLAMVLIYSDMSWAGFAIYVKEVGEFALFILYLSKRRRSRRE